MDDSEALPMIIFTLCLLAHIFGVASITYELYKAKWDWLCASFVTAAIVGYWIFIVDIVYSDVCGVDDTLKTTIFIIAGVLPIVYTFLYILATTANQDGF